MKKNMLNLTSQNPENPCGTSICGGGGSLLINKTKRPLRAKAHKFFGAFTLSEVLVTLTIIGIVASIVVPSVYNNYQRNQFVTKYRKAYSALNSVFDQWAIETNYANSHLGGNAATNMENMLKARMSVKNEKVPSYSNFVTQYNEGKGVKALNGQSISGGFWRQGGVVLKDGTQISMSCGHAHWVYITWKGNFIGEYSCSFFIDVNGESKGPNTLGKDMFYVLGLHDGLYPYPLDIKYKLLTDVAPSKNGGYRATKNITCNKKTSSGYGCSSWFLNHTKYQD